MAIEDLTTYTEVDPGDAITTTASRVTAFTLARNESDYLYKDFGTGFFDEIDLLFTCNFASGSQNDALAYFGFANNVGDANAWTGTYLQFEFNRWDAPGIAYYLDMRSPTDFDSYEISADTVYYCHLGRESGSDTATIDIYSDAARTVLLKTETVTGLGTTKWRYFYAMASFNDAASPLFYGYFENFDFGRTAAASQVRIIGMMM